MLAHFFRSFDSTFEFWEIWDFYEIPLVGKIKCFASMFELWESWNSMENFFSLDYFFIYLYFSIIYLNEFYLYSG